jgi:hypothetical protein
MPTPRETQRDADNGAARRGDAPRFYAGPSVRLLRGALLTNQAVHQSGRRRWRGGETISST